MPAEDDFALVDLEEAVIFDASPPAPPAQSLEKSPEMVLREALSLYNQMFPIDTELVETTLDYLIDDSDSLFQCASVGQLWRHPAQACIFRTISLGVGLQDGFATGLVDLPTLQ
ncbi:hypothetical protein DFH09DRAFT_1338332 [Mycena vulgaris]|nr:hypothetical protein DFH09DRAFT_1338332 [Mycena vulgaris]